jgi:hypothetical protein
MCEEESDDQEAVAKLLEINDSIHRTIERYKLMKAGNVDAANKIERGTLGTTTGVGKNAANELSLIDFDAEPPAPSASADTNGSLLDGGSASTTSTMKPKTVEDDLLGLSLSDSGSGQLGSISLGPSSAPFGSIFSSTPQASLSQQPKPQTPAFPSYQPAPSPKPNYDAFASLTSALPPSKPSTPAPASQQARQIKQTPVDPFAALISAGPRPSTPASQGNTQLKPQQQGKQNIQANATESSAADDEWLFESALPTPQSIQVLSSSVRIDFEPRRLPGQSAIQITARFSNTTPQRITGLHFQVAVEKSYSLQLKTQSGREMPPNSNNSIQQEILLNGIPEGKGDTVKMRFKVSYEHNGQSREEQGNVPSLGIS